MAQVTNNIIINDILIPALKRLYQVDYDNIRFGVSERNICARLAHHMENIMRDYDSSHSTKYFRNYYADVEYNRMGNGELKMYENTEKLPQYMVSDLLIQSRGYERNYLAVETKRKGNSRNAKEDRERLSSMVASRPKNEEQRCVHDTLVGAFIVYGINNIKIDIYENRSKKGELTNSLELCYDELMELL